MTKKNCPSHFISQEPYIIWSWFMVFMCKRIISPGIFYIFSKFWFSGSIVRKKSKKWPKITKNYVCCTPYQSKHTSFDCVFCCTSLELWHLQILFSFFKILVFWVVRGEGEGKGQKMAQNDKKKIVKKNWGTVPHMIGFWYTCVKWWYLQQFFFFFSKFWFFGFFKVYQ